MPGPNILTKNEAVVALTPLVWPMINDRAIIGTPIPGNNLVAGVDIFYAGEHTTLTTDQYELLRTQVVIPITETYFLKPLGYSTPLSEIEKHIKVLIEQAFNDY